MPNQGSKNPRVYSGSIKKRSKRFVKRWNEGGKKVFTLIVPIQERYKGEIQWHSMEHF
jgi:hypothetical protein